MPRPYRVAGSPIVCLFVEFKTTWISVSVRRRVPHGHNVLDVTTNGRD